jgi:multiple sugar transport system permease protein
LLVYGLLLPSTVVMVAPILWLLLLSVRPESVIQDGVGSITSLDFTLSNYAVLWGNYNILQYTLNSLVVCLVPSFISVVLALLAAYPLVRYKFRGRAVVYAMPLFAQVVPIILLALPLYLAFLAVHMLDTYVAVILGHLALVLPLAIWMMAGYLRGVPRDMEEQALVDGCSRLSAIVRVVLPVLMPGAAATFAVSFIAAWGQFVVGYFLTSSESMRILPVALYNFIPGNMSASTWGLLFAMTAVYMFPVLVVFAFAQRGFQQDVAAGAVAAQ